MNPELHLDTEALRRLESGRASPAEARRWAAHLAEDCAACEAFLATRVGLLDGEVDAALADLAPARPEEAGNDLEFARIQRAVRGRRPARRMMAFAAVAAASLLGAGVVFQIARAPRSDWTGEKGAPSARVVPAKLRFAVAGSGAGVERGASGQELPADASLLFRIEVGAPAQVALLRVGGGDREVVFQGRAEKAGPVDVSVDGKPAAYPLRGLSGAQRFILVASAGPISADELAAAARLLGGQAAERDPRTPELTVDVVEVTVR